MTRLGCLLVASLLAVTLSLALNRPALSANNGNTTFYEAINTYDPYSSCTTGPTCNAASPWWSGLTVGVSQRYGCTSETREPDSPPPNNYCPFPYNLKWHQGIDLLLGRGATLYSAVSGTVVDYVFTTCIDPPPTCPTLGYLGIRTLSGNVVYLLHGSPTPNFARIGQLVNVGDAVYTTGGNGNSSGYHLHFEVHSSLSGMSTLSSPVGPGDDVNPEPWLQYQGPRAATVSSATNRLDMFVRGRDGGIFEIHRVGSTWSTWAGLTPPGTGTTFAGQISALSNATNQIFLYGVGVDGNLYQNYTTDGSLTWSGWSNRGQPSGTGGAPLIGTPAATAWSSNQNLSIVARGTNGNLYHQVWSPLGGWGGWENLGGYAITDPTMISPGSSRLDVFTLGDLSHNGHSYHLSYTGSWVWDPDWGAAPNGANFVSQPMAGSLSATYIDAFATSADGFLYKRHFEWQCMDQLAIRCHCHSICSWRTGCS